MKRYPWLAAALNFVIPGAGYIYAGIRVRFGVLLVAAIVLIAFGPTPEYSRAVEIDTEAVLLDPSTIVMGIAGLLIAGGFAYDAYLDAKSFTRKNKKQT